MRRKTTILFLLLFASLCLSVNAKESGSDIFAPPANDDCANATTLTMNSNFLCTSTSPGTVLDATASSTPNACPNSSTNADDDVWFKFVATGTDHKLELLNISGSQPLLYHTIFDAGVAGDCTAMTAVACSDQNTNDLTGLTIGNTYFISVFTIGNASNDTTFDICLGSAPTPPVNDDCASAESVASFPFNATVDATSATNNAGFIDVAGCGGAMNDGVWYTFLGDGNNVTVNVVPTAWDAKIAIYTGSCGAFTCVGEANNGLVGNTETETFTSTVGVTYYINIAHPDGTVNQDEGVFSLDITSDVLSLDYLIENGFSFYPNPVGDELTLNAKEDIKSINVYNMIGQEVTRINLPNVSTYKLDMSNLSKGVYFITTKIGESTGTFKVIKK